MTDPALTAALEEVYGLESTSFIRYLIGNAEVQVRDDFDRKVRSFFIDWYRATDLNRAAFLDVLEEEGHVPSSFGFPLRFSEYNYLNAAYLLGPVIRFMASEIEEKRRRLPALEAWPRAHQLVEAVLEREEPYLARARELASETPVDERTPARIKGTSASRW